MIFKFHVFHGGIGLAAQMSLCGVLSTLLMAGPDGRLGVTGGAYAIGVAGMVEVDAMEKTPGFLPVTVCLSRPVSSKTNI